MQKLGDDEKRDMAKLISLFSQFEMIISEIIKNKAFFKNEYIYSLILELWETELKYKITSLGKDLYNGRYYKELKEVGLTGKQLDLKFSILSYFFYGEMAEVDLLDKDTFRFRSRSKLPALTNRIINGFFDFFNSLFGSLQSAIPMAETLKEFKDMIHFEIKYNSNVAS